MRQKVREEFAMGKKGLQKKDRHMLELKRKEWALSQDFDTTQFWLKAIDRSRSNEKILQDTIAKQLRLQQQCMRNWRTGQELRTRYDKIRSQYSVNSNDTAESTPTTPTQAQDQPPTDLEISSPDESSTQDSLLGMSIDW